MNWQPQTTQQMRQQRAQMLSNTRAFFQYKNILEVETPALSQAANTDPFIQSFQSDKRYLHTSPEYPMKRLLADGSGDIYQICKVWRKEEAGNNHNPEFTLLEWYRVGFDYHQLMQEVSNLLHALFNNKSSPTCLFTLKQDNQFHTYEELFLEKLNINPHNASHSDLIHCVKENISGLSCDGLDQQAMLDALLTHCIEPTFPQDQLIFIYDYPASQSALAQIREPKAQNKTAKICENGGGGNKGRYNNKYPVAERFEVYLGQMELGNGYQEETNYERNKQILQSENNARKVSQQETVIHDKLFLSACKFGIPESAGVAIGLDRVLMCITGEKSIQKVINFPWDKA